MKLFFLAMMSVVFFSGCSATWSGVKDDTSNVVDWSKEKVNQGATYIKQKTE